MRHHLDGAQIEINNLILMIFKVCFKITVSYPELGCFRAMKKKTKNAISLYSTP